MNMLKLDDAVNKVIPWQKDEALKGNSNCSELVKSGNKLFGASMGHHGSLVATNQRVLFACKSGLAKSYVIMYSVNLENIASVSRGSFGPFAKVVISDLNNNSRDFLANSLIIPIINAAITERKNRLQAHT